MPQISSPYYGPSPTPISTGAGAPYDPYAAQRAAARGMAAGSGASSYGAGYNPSYNPSAGADAMASASGMASANAGAPGPQYAPDGHLMTQAEISDRARAQGAGASADASSGAAGVYGQQQQSAQGNAMANASGLDGYGASAPPPPMPGAAGYQSPGLNVPYGTWDNVSQYANPYAFNIPRYGQSNPMTGQGATAANASSYMNPAAQNIPGGAYNPMMGQAATMGNIQDYVNPFLDKIISNGSNAIEHSGAARGLFGSTGNINDIGNWAANASSQAYNDAANRFGQDRGYFSGQAWNQYGAGVNAQQDAMNRFGQDRSYFNNNDWQGYNAGANAAQNATNQFNTDRNAVTNQYNTNNSQNSQDYWNTYNANWDQYKYGNADYQGRLGDYYNQNNGISQTGQGAANNVGTLQSNLGNALSQLYGNRGAIGMQGAVNSGNQSSGLIDGLLGAIIPMLLGG